MNRYTQQYKGHQEQQKYILIIRKKTDMFINNFFKKILNFAYHINLDSGIVDYV